MLFRPQNEVIKKNKLYNLLSGLVKDAVFLLLQLQSLHLSENPITLLRIHLLYYLPNSRDLRQISLLSSVLFLIFLRIKY